MMLKKILFVLLIVSTLVAGTYGYLYIKNLKKPKILATQAIPQGCSFVIESDDFLKLFKKLNETNLIWEELQQITGVKELNQHYGLVDSIINSNERIKAIFDNNKVYIAAYPGKDTHTDFLFVLNLPDINYTEEVNNYLKSNAQKYETSDAAEGEKITTVYFKQSLQPVYFYSNSGMLAISANQELLKNTVEQKNKNVLANDAYFSKLEESAGTDADFRFFVNHQFNQQHAEYFDKAIPQEGIMSIRNAKGWTELDVDFTPNELMMNGYTLCDSSVLLKALGKQEPCEIEFTSIAPATTSSFVFLGISDREKFAGDIFFTTETAEEKNKYDKKLDIDLINSIQQIAGEEIILLHTNDHDTTADYALAKINDRDKALNFLHQVADSIIGLLPGDSVCVFNDAAVFNVFSFHLYSFQPRYCTVINDYILFAESCSKLQRYKACLSQNQTLARNEQFVHFADNHLGNETNFYLYTSFSGSQNFLSSFFNQDIKDLFNRYNQLFEKFNALAYQITSYKGKLLDQAYVLYSPAENKQNNSVWETQLDTLTVMQPQVVTNHKTGGKEVFIQDAAGKIYLISNTGKIIWSKKIEGSIMGKVVQVDYFKNEKLQLLFNTETAIHLIDRNGNYVQGYPVGLKSRATNGISVFDYELNKDYRILLACEDKKIYDYNIFGKEVEGFVFPPTQAKVSLPVEWLRINQKDYLLVADSAGNVYGTGRRGEARLSFKHRLPAGINAWYPDPGKDIGKSYIHCIDAGNKNMVKLSLSDELQNISFESELKTKQVKIALVNDDQLNDYVLLDENGFEIHDDAGKILLSYNSKQELMPLLKVMNFDKQAYFMVVLKENGLCKIIGTDGKEIETASYNATCEPVLSNINNDAQSYLLSVSGNKVICYTFQLMN